MVCLGVISWMNPLLTKIQVVRAYASVVSVEIKSRLRGMITIATFSKLLSLSDQSLSRFSDCSLLRDDLVTVQNLIPKLQDIGVRIVSVTISGYLLWQLIGLNLIVTILVSVGEWRLNLSIHFIHLTISIGSLFFCGVLGEQIAISRQQWGKASKARTVESTKLLQSIKYAKMTGVTGLTLAVLDRLQRAEAASRIVFWKQNIPRFMFSTFAIKPLYPTYLTDVF